MRCEIDFKLYVPVISIYVMFFKIVKFNGIFGFFDCCWHCCWHKLSPDNDRRIFRSIFHRNQISRQCPVFSLPLKNQSNRREGSLSILRKCGRLLLLCSSLCRNFVSSRPFSILTCTNDAAHSGSRTIATSFFTVINKVT